jgi:hypothetical protein
MGTNTFTFEYSIDGTNWVIIDHASIAMEGFSIQRQIHKNLQPSTDSCQFTVLSPDDTLVGYLNTYNTNQKSIQVKITYDGATVIPVFRGWVDSETSGEITTKIQKVDLKVYDESSRLEKKVGQRLDIDPPDPPTVFKGLNWFIYKSTDTAHSILYYLLVRYGLDVSRITPSDVKDKDGNYIVIDWFVLSKDDKYSDILTELLYEFGYVYYFDASGNFCTKNMMPAAALSATATFDDTKIEQPMSWQKKLIQKDGAEVKYYEHLSMPNTIIHSLTEGQDATNKCKVEIPKNWTGSGDYASPFWPKTYVPSTWTYPPPAPLPNPKVYSEYKVDQRKLIFAQNCRLDKSFDSSYLQIINDPGADPLSTTSNPMVFYATEAFIAIRNTDSAAAHNIHKFDIIGDAIVQGNMGMSTYYLVSSAYNDMLTVDAKYIATKTQADWLSSGLGQYLKYSNVNYKITTDGLKWLGGGYPYYPVTVEPNVGDIVILNSFTANFGSPTTYCRVYSKSITFQYSSGYDAYIPVFEFVLEGITVYTQQSTTSTQKVYNPVSITNNASNIVGPGGAALTKNEDQHGYEDPAPGSEGTMLPINSIPSILDTAAFGIRGIRVVWRRDNSIPQLTNFSHYEIIVSDDNVNWYYPAVGVEGDQTIPAVGNSWRSGTGAPAINSTYDIDTKIYTNGSPSGIPTAVEQFLHVGIPPLGDFTHPVGRTLYYKVRTITKAGLASPWSNSGQATTTLAASADIHADTIYGTHIHAETISGDKLTPLTITADRIEDLAISGKVIKHADQGAQVGIASTSWVELADMAIDYVGIPDKSFILVLFHCQINQAPASYPYFAGYDYRGYPVWVTATEIAYPEFTLCIDGVSYPSSYTYGLTTAGVAMQAVFIFDSAAVNHDQAIWAPGNHRIAVYTKKPAAFTHSNAAVGARHLISQMLRK